MSCLKPLKAAQNPTLQIFTQNSVICLFCFFSGQSPAEVENLFLQKASSLDTYGVDPHPVKVSVLMSFTSNYAVEVFSILNV